MMEPIIIQAGKSGGRYWRDLWRYRELFCLLAWRDILVRYKQTAAGIAWAVLRPLLMMGIFTVVFGKFANLPSQGAPYAILVFAALLPWQFFSNAMSESGNSLLNSSNLITKVYFPRMILPASAVITSFVDFAIAAVLLGGLMAVYQFAPGWQIAVLPLLALLAFAAALGAGLWLGALTVKYRDFRILVPFLVQIGFFISPVGYSSEIVPEEWRLLYSLNPLAGIIDGFRWAILGHEMYWPGFLLSTGTTAVLLISGIAWFRRVETDFADTI